jgi:hypothetical protein
MLSFAVSSSTELYLRVPDNARLWNSKMTRHCERGLDDRCRDQDGRIRQKNGKRGAGTCASTRRS